MKKFFLIPLMALFTCVSAWAVEVSTKDALQAALNAGGEITLGGDIDLEGTGVTLNSGNVTLDLNNHTLSSSIGSQKAGGVIKVNGGNLTINATGGGAITNTNSSHAGNALLLTNGSLVINAGTYHGTYEAIFASAGTITINGGVFETTYDNDLWMQGNVTGVINGGTFNGAWCCFQVDNGAQLTINGGIINMGTPAMDAEYIFYLAGGSVNVVGGSYNGQNPMEYVDLTSRVIFLSDGKYIVAAPTANVVAYNPSLLETYTSLADAVAAASAADEIYMHKADATAISVDKNLMIHTNGLSTNLTAASGYARADMGQNIVFTDNAIAAFLMADGTNSMTIDANADISAAGAIHVNGDKTLTINAGVEVLYKRQGSLANIVVDNSAKLTILGSGTFKPVMHSETKTINGFTAEISATAGNQVGNRVIDVDGELVVGAKNDAANCPHFITSSIARGSAVMVNATGVATFNNADMHVACMSIKNYGSVTIHGGEYVSIATYQNGVNDGWYAYHLNNEGLMTVNGGHFVGVQGAFSNANESAIVDINGGYFETVNGHNWLTGEANEKDNHYALYVACYSVVNVYGGYYKVTTPSAGGGKVVLVGNNDAYNTYGVVNLYGGNFQRKVEVSPRKNKDSSYPASVPSTSAWYSCFGSEAPLPAGYEYYETGDATYPWGVRVIAGKEVDAIDPEQKAAQEADPTYTIPWQQETTWASEEVPEENTIVTIPVGATVVVSNEEEETTATAEQVFVNQGATLKVESGTVLNVGDGGVNVANGGQIVVEPGAIITVGSAGLVTTEDEALVVESSDTNQGAFLIAPTVTENTQPKATVKLTSKAQQLGAEEFVFERFAIPTKDGSQTKYNAEHLDTVTIYNDGVFAQGLYKWDGSTWADVASFKDLEPFKGYQLTNTSKYGNVVYTFEGNLVGNTDQDFSFAGSGFGFFGNSYSADINILKFLDSFGSDMQKTIWIYDPYTDQFKTVTKSSYGSVYYGTRANRKGKIEDIRSMQAFLMNTFAEGESSTGVDYASAIWGNPKYNLVSAAAPARYEAVNEDRVTIYVATQTQEDEVTFIQSEEYSNDFDNGADANKWMNEGMNLYIVTMLGDMSDVATNDITDMTITFKSGNESNYVLGFDNLKGQEFAIRDILTGAVINMKEGATYEFTQEPNTTVNARFQIVGSHKVPTGLENSEGAPVMQKIIKNGTLYILRDSEWYTVDGQEVK